jgi:hypothetical protein
MKDGETVEDYNYWIRLVSPQVYVVGKSKSCTLVFMCNNQLNMTQWVAGMLEATHAIMSAQGCEDEFNDNLVLLEPKDRAGQESLRDHLESIDSRRNEVKVGTPIGKILDELPSSPAVTFTMGGPK